MGKSNRYYDDEFKASVVKMVVEKGRSITEVSKDLGVSQPSLASQMIQLQKNLWSLKQKIGSSKKS
jgi:transposase-like protein